MSGTHQATDGARRDTDGQTPDWVPDPALADASPVAAFARRASATSGRDLREYRDLWRWSVEEPNAFWTTLWEHLGMPSLPPGTPALADRSMPGARWFPGTTLNYAAEVFRDRPTDDVAVVAETETGARREVTWGELQAQAAAVAAALRARGVGVGDRVVGYLPNGVEAVVAFLATASIGAVWAVCGLDYAGAAAADRLGQLDPLVLVAATTATVGGRTIDRSAEVARLRETMPSLRTTIIVGERDARLPGAQSFDDLLTGGATAIEPVALPFDHPLWVLFSSGTTGRPKGIVHGHGGVILEHRKQMSMHLGLRAGDRLFWYTSPSWMMWNFLVGALLEGVSVVCYDGSPSHPAVDRLWELAERWRVQVLGASPGYLSACQKAGVDIGDRELDALRAVCVTGSTFPTDLHQWWMAQVPPSVQVSSCSGGTDVVSGFASSAPNLPVWAGELSAPCLGVDLCAYDAKARTVVGDVGELVVRRPLPSMPLRFWNDPDGERLRTSYFDAFPGVWRHGDWITVTGHGSVVIHGRSDATLNRRGVRMGSSDIYGPVEEIPEVTEALVVGLEEPDGGYWMPMYVTLADGVELDDDLRARIVTAIRAGVSPRHVPDEIHRAPGIPHTRTGKKLEVPVKRLLRGDDLDSILDPASVDRPDLLDWYRQQGALRRHARTEASPHPDRDR
ncbi:acetoacetate--CoA ligase [Actinomadura syzygii]|uniref:Acetoacetate--CoA ligase n=1 Tax=Actinomadura syzygii TaxID=1427538 RepID=A0A5D0UCW3_9ACTN|nr:acetoacetate--CoA ligase [Actinomadura syzygii]TYC15917.1 acetoacetate--CoA ligase [Actinomadura syzygii]